MESVDPQSMLGTIVRTGGSVVGLLSRGRILIRATSVAEDNPLPPSHLNSGIGGMFNPILSIERRLLASVAGLSGFARVVYAFFDYFRRHRFLNYLVGLGFAVGISATVNYIAGLHENVLGKDLRNGWFLSTVAPVASILTAFLLQGIPYMLVRYGEERRLETERVYDENQRSSACLIRDLLEEGHLYQDVPSPTVVTREAQNAVLPCTSGLYSGNQQTAQWIVSAASLAAPEQFILTANGFYLCADTFRPDIREQYGAMHPDALPLVDAIADNAPGLRRALSQFAGTLRLMFPDVEDPIVESAFLVRAQRTGLTQELALKLAAKVLDVAREIQSSRSAIGRQTLIYKVPFVPNRRIMVVGDFCFTQAYPANSLAIREPISLIHRSDRPGQYCLVLDGLRGLCGTLWNKVL